jgi:transcription antitermination factor NusG
VAYWSCAQLETNRVELALHFLKLNGFTTYTPRVRVERKLGGPDGTALLFPGYTFISIELQRHRASRTPGVAKLIMDGEHPGRVPDRIIAELLSREQDGVIELPRRPAFRRGDRVRVVRGALQGQLAVFEGMRSHQRVAVLLAFLDSERRLELERRDIRRLNGQA